MPWPSGAPAAALSPVQPPAQRRCLRPTRCAAADVENPQPVGSLRQPYDDRRPGRRRGCSRGACCRRRTARLAPPARYPVRASLSRSSPWLPLVVRSPGPNTLSHRRTSAAKPFTVARTSRRICSAVIFMTPYELFGHSGASSRRRHRRLCPVDRSTRRTGSSARASLPRAHCSAARAVSGSRFCVASPTGSAVGLRRLGSRPQRIPTQSASVDRSCSTCRRRQSASPSPHDAAPAGRAPTSYAGSVRSLASLVLDGTAAMRRAYEAVVRRRP